MGLEVGGAEKEEEEVEEKIPHMCESIGHRLLRGRCPATSLNYNHNYLMLLRLFYLT